MTTPRVRSIELRGDSVIVTGVASGPGADVTRTLWFETVEGAAVAEKTGATTLTRRVVYPAGTPLSTETDPVGAGTPDAHAPLARSERETARGAQRRAVALGASVVEMTYVPLFGGTAEIVVQPADPAEFVRRAGSALSKLLGPLSQDNGAFIVVVVDSEHTPLLVLGWAPGVGGGTGQGLAWQAPGMHSSAIVGTPVTVNK